MVRAFRLLRMLRAMKASGFAKAADLADLLGVTTRTIYRDISLLRGRGWLIFGSAGVGYLYKGRRRGAARP